MLDQIETSFAEQQHALDAKERSEDRLRRFVADASHELRTPLTAVRGYADLYRAGGLADPAELDTRDGPDRDREPAHGRLVEDLLLLARLDQGRPIRRDPVDLSRIANDAVPTARAIEPDRPVVGAIDPGVVVTGDDDRLRQVLGNLRRQRARARAGRGRRWRSSCERATATAELRVVDHGPGIDPEHGARVFDRFYRADAGRVARQRRHRPGPRHRRRRSSRRTAVGCGTRRRPGAAPRSWCSLAHHSRFTAASRRAYSHEPQPVTNPASPVRRAATPEASHEAQHDHHRHPARDRPARRGGRRRHGDIGRPGRAAARAPPRPPRPTPDARHRARP